MQISYHSDRSLVTGAASLMVFRSYTSFCFHIFDGVFLGFEYISFFEYAEHDFNWQIFTFLLEIAVFFFFIH